MELVLRTQGTLYGETARQRAALMGLYLSSLARTRERGSWLVWPTPVEEATGWISRDLARYLNRATRSLL
ncbi:hypothetical protein [Tortoise microvirus 72]|nr:hypothetical protein [Tortoise microvirus 72]